MTTASFSTALFIAIISAIIAFASGIGPYFWAKFSQTQRERITFLVKTAVELAEQTIVGEKAGAERYEFVEAWLKDRGIEISSEELKAYIESAVYSLKSHVTAVKN